MRGSDSACPPGRRSPGISHHIHGMLNIPLPPSSLGTDSSALACRFPADISGTARVSGEHNTREQIRRADQQDFCPQT